MSVKGIAVLLVLVGARPAVAQREDPGASGRSDTLALSLADALARARTNSEEVRLARAQVDLASAQVLDARASALPQISGSAMYTRTFASAFQNAGFSIPDSLRFEPDSMAPLAQRVGYLEDHVVTAGLVGLGQLFSNLPFGQENTYQATVTGSQMLYSGGRVGAALNIAHNFRDAAGLQMTEQLADLELQVRSAYYQAQLAGQLQGIAEAAVAQAEQFLEQEQLRQRAGESSELDVLRAQVSLANLRPQEVQARNAAELARLQLKRLVNVPLTRRVRLTTALDVPTAEELAPPQEDAGVLLQQRAAIKASERQVQIRRQQVRVARGAYLPSLSLRMSYGKQLFPTGIFDFNGVPRTDWTASLSMDIPIFDGLRRSAQVQEAQIQLSQARLQLAQLREQVQLQYEQALGERERAAAEIAARQQTVAQAQRVYDLTVLRYDRGLATQLEVSDARLSLLQARTNLAQGLSDFYVADATYRRSLGLQPGGGQ